MSSYLTNRKQKVIISADAKSGSLNANSGVPQGTVLGYLLFLIYSNDLPEAIKSAHVKQNADDTFIIISNKDKLVIKNNCYLG